MKSKVFVKVIVFCTIFTMLLTNMALAVSFTDIDDCWAKSYIKDMAEKGVIKGEPDGRFNPKGKVTFLHAFLMMSRMYDIKDELVKQEIYDYYKDFKDILEQTSNGDYAWAYEDLSVALASDMILQSALVTYIKTGKINQPATKQEIATFLTKAMVLQDEAQSQDNCVLPFNDADEISSLNKQYVYTMYEKGIITGDEKNRFLPKSHVTRDVMATMLSRSMKYMDKNDIEPDFSSFLEDLTTVEGSISDITKSRNTTHIKVKKSDGYNSIYETNEDMILTIEGKKSSVSKLEVGMVVECKIKDDNILRSIKAEHKSEEYKGRVNYTSYVSPKEISIILEDDEDSKEKTKKIAVDNEVDVILNGNEAELKDLNRGDVVTVKVKNEKAHEIVAESKNKKYQGVFDQIIYDRTIKIAFTDLNDKYKQFEIQSDLDVERNDKESSIDQLTKGDKIEIETEYDLIKSIDATSVESESNGYIKQIVIGPKNKITLSNEDHSVEYIVSENANINVDKKLSSIYDLRVGYYIEFNLQGEEIVSIEAKAIADNKEVVGIVSSIYKDIGVLMVSVTKNNGDVETRRIEVTSKTKIMDIYSIRSEKLSDIDVGDQVRVLGTNESGLFTATTIMWYNPER